MQLNVERGAPATGKTIRLIQTARASGQDEHQIITGNAYKPADLELLVRHRISRGAKVICIDECSEQHIECLQRLGGRLPDELTIHAVVSY
ncbi:hypothetical protein E8F20_27580 [Pseudomonas sp. BN415]|uniref:hypothetical protein n=1 Tax=Pseudomonas sp. BN415 TaxID=2567889 RepID=UPI0024580228|nr:hypothetical protein [Pseudomonas sp. BN415]MDH4585613.1 hypothetical protein [Pseudomonas sp. BN415]